jgi:tetratricopeptide (TPR) repeat protein
MVAAVRSVCAATIGPLLDADLLMEILGLHPADLFAHLEAGVRALFLDEGQGAFSFHHDLVREALAAGLTSPWRGHVHRTAARLLEARQAQDPVQVAQHARLGGDVMQAVSTLQVAARTCLRRMDYAEAERLLTEALELEDNADSRLQRAEVRIAMGQFSRAAEDARAAMVRGAGSAGMEMAAWCAYYLGEFPYALTLAEEGAALAESPGVRARCLVIAGRLLHADGHLQAAELRYSEAGRLADETGLTTLASVWLAGLRCDQGRARDALELLRVPQSGVDDSDQPLTARHRQLARARALMMLGQVEDALQALDQLSAEDGRTEFAEGGPDGANLRAAIFESMGELEAADQINLKEVSNARAAHLRPLLEVSLVGLAESRLLAGARRSASRYLGEAVRARVGTYPFKWFHQGRIRLLQGRLELAAERFDRALALSRELLVDATQSGDVVHAVYAKLLEAEALAASGSDIDTRAVDSMLKNGSDLLGGDAWRLTARLAKLTGNSGWESLAARQLERLVQASGRHAAGVLSFAQGFQERLGRTE